MDTAALDKVDAQSAWKIYLYSVTIVNLDSVGHIPNAVYFSLISNKDAVYDIVSDPAIRQQIPSQEVFPGQHVSGQIAFQIPDGEQPSRLLYYNPDESINITMYSLPPPSVWVSEIYGASASVQGAGAGAYRVSASLQNHSVWYYSTDNVWVTVTIASYNSQTPSIQITSIAVSNQEFGILTTRPTLPYIVRGDGTTYAIDLALALPQVSVNAQTLNLLVTTS